MWSILRRSSPHGDAGEAKTDTIDGETLVRTLLAHKRGEPRVCAMVRPPDSPGGGPTPDLSRTQDGAG